MAAMAAIGRLAAALTLTAGLAAVSAISEPARAAERSDDGALEYHGGAVLNHTTHVYYLWYGDWSESLAMPVLTDFASSLGGSPYFNINTTHHDAAGQPVRNSIAYSGSADDGYSLGASLTDADVLKLVKAAIHRGALPVDANGIYFVLTAADVDETSGFCSDFCSWHHHARIAGTDIKYAFVGNPGRCPKACELAPGNTPNGDSVADAMVAAVAARINETVTDPDADGWFDAEGLENTDKCLLSRNPFGPTFVTSDGAWANLRLGARNFLVPQNWVNGNDAEGGTGGHCALRYP
jgi:hypothetical protein